MIALFGAIAFALTLTAAAQDADRVPIERLDRLHASNVNECLADNFNADCVCRQDVALEAAYEQFNALHPDYGSGEASVYWRQARDFYNTAVGSAQCTPDALGSAEAALAQKRAEEFVETSFGLRPRVEELEVRYALEIGKCSGPDAALCVCRNDAALKTVYDQYYDGLRELSPMVFEARLAGRYGGMIDNNGEIWRTGAYDQELSVERPECSSGSTD